MGGSHLQGPPKTTYHFVTICRFARHFEICSKSFNTMNYNNMSIMRIEVSLGFTCGIANELIVHYGMLF